MMMGDYIILGPGVVAGLFGLVLFIMTIRCRWFIGVTAFVAALAELLFYLLIVDTSSTCSRLPPWIESICTLFSFLGGAVFLAGTTVLIALSKNLKWKKCMIMASTIGTVLAIGHLAIVLKGLSEIP